MWSKRILGLAVEVKWRVELIYGAAGSSMVDLGFRKRSCHRLTLSSTLMIRIQYPNLPRVPHLLGSHFPLHPSLAGFES